MQQTERERVLRQRENAKKETYYMLLFSSFITVSPLETI
uniref:Uncharacterized protein n=1 Tax=Rhizophora mucronata TaxID=61149 RepID=A0A2P2QYE1_RHIMU